MVSLLGLAFDPNFASEEVDVSLAPEGAGKGLNFGWNIMEGKHCADFCQGWVRSFRVAGGAATELTDWRVLQPGGSITKP